MLNERFNTFADRQEIIALFRHLYEHNPKQPLPLLPILLLLAPSGGGISTLIDLLVERSNSTLTYAHIDFAQDNTGVSMQELLQNICDQLHRSDNSQMKKVNFPRCELALSMLLNPIANTNSWEIRKQIEQKVSKSLPVYEQFDDLINALSNWLLPVTLVVVLFKWLLKVLERHFPPLRELMLGSAIKWYKKNSRNLRLPMSSDVTDVLVRLYEWSKPGEAKQRLLAVEELLLAAFLEDVRDAFDKKRKKRAIERTSLFVLFLDNFDVSIANGVGKDLLDILLKSRAEGNTDPLLVVIGSHQRFFNSADPLQNPPFELNERKDENHGNEYTFNLYNQWRERIQKKQFDSSPYLFLPLWLHDLGLEESLSSLLRGLGQGQLQPFEYATLVEDVYNLTHGHPMALKLAADILQVGRTQGRNIPAHQIMQEPISSHSVLIPNHEQVTVEAYLLSTLLRQLSATEQEQCVDFAAPRAINLPLLKNLLAIQDEKELLSIWERYSRLCFVRTHNRQTIVLHPLVRDLLNRRLIAKSTPRKDYYKVVHTNLREYFNELVMSSVSEEQIHEARQEEAYHALALGDPEIAISYLCTMLSQGNEVWKDTLEKITQAPTIRMPAYTDQRAIQALFTAKQDASQARQEHQLRSVVTALVLFSWQLHIPDIAAHKRVNLWYELSEAYRYLPTRDYQTSQQIAKSYYERAHKAAMKNTPLLRNLPPLSPPETEPFPVRQVSRFWKNLRFASTIIFLCSALISYPSIYYGNYENKVCNPHSILSPLKVVKAIFFSHGIAVTHASDGECIGVSDGTFAFDITTNPTSGADKAQAADALLSGDLSNSNIFWNKASREDTSDAETLIYKENENVLELSSSQHLPYITVVVLTMLTGLAQDQKSVAKGRDDLQGAYIAQKEHNKNFQTPLLRLLIANTGGSSKYAVQVARQIVNMAHNDPTIVAVLGPTQSRNETIAATKILGAAHIPMVSGTASSDAFTAISPYFFRVAPPNKDQVFAAAKYAEQQWNIKKAVLFEDLNDNYSKDLAEQFSKQFQDRDGNMILARELYNANDTDVSNTIVGEARHACSYNPELIYFTGRSANMDVLMNNLNPCGNNLVKVMGGDSLDQLATSPNPGYPSFTYNRLFYTTFGYPSEWSPDAYKAFKPIFFEDYSQYYDPGHLYTNTPTYGYSLANGQVILVYDALITLLEAIMKTVKNTSKVLFHPEDLLQAFSGIHGPDAIQGASGVIDFGPHPNGDPVNKVVIILGIDVHGIAQPVPKGIIGNILKHEKSPS